MDSLDNKIATLIQAKGRNSVKETSEVLIS